MAEPASGVTVEAPASINIGGNLANAGPSLSASSDSPDLSQLGAKPALSATKPGEVIAPEATEAPATQADAKPAEGEAKPAETAETAPADPKPEPKGVGKRLAEQNAAIEAEKRRADELGAKLAEATEALKKLSNPEKSDPKPDRPTRDKFDDPAAYEAAIDKYGEDLSGWAARTAAKDAEAKIAAETKAKAEADQKAANEVTAKQNYETVAKSFTERVVKAREAHADYDEIAGRDDVTVTQAMSAAIMLSDDGAEIAYYLGKNPEKAAEIAAMPEPLQLVALGRISTEVATEAVRARVSKAPDPPSKIGGRSNAGPKGLHQMTMEEHAAAYRQEQAAKRSGNGPRSVFH